LGTCLSSKVPIFVGLVLAFITYLKTMLTNTCYF